MGARNPIKSTSELLSLDESRCLKNQTPGPKFLIVERTDKDATMEKVSPFLIKQVVTTIAGEIEKCVKLRSGQLLIETKKGKTGNEIGPT